MRKILFVLPLFVAAGSWAGGLPPRSSSQIPDSAFGFDFQNFTPDIPGSILASNTVSIAAGHGVKWARVWADWRLIEQTPGVYHFDGLDNLVRALSAQGISMQLTITGNGQTIYAGGNAPTVANGAMTAWLNFVQQTVQRYQGSVTTWEIWNEPNLGWAPSVNPADYADLAVRTAAKIRAAQPSAFIILGGTSLIDLTFLQNVLPTAGASVNAVAIHPYRQFPEQSQDTFVANSAVVFPPGGVKPNPAFTPTGAADYAGEIAALRTQLTTLGFPNLKIWSNETGYPAQNETFSLWTGSETQQAKHLSRYFMSNLSLGVQRAIYYQSLDNTGVIANLYTAPGQPFLDDYRNSSRVLNSASFATFAPLYNQPGASIGVAATAFTASSNVAVAGSTITATALFPNNFADYSIPIPQAGNYQVWVHAFSTSTTKSTFLALTVNGSSITVNSAGTYNYYALNLISAGLQGASDYSKPYYSPFIYAGPSQVFYPAIFPLANTATLRLQLLDAGTQIDEIRLSPVGAFTPRKAYTAFASLAAIFDSGVNLAANVATIQNVDLAANEWAAFHSAYFTNAQNVPILAYWVGLLAVDSFPNRSVRVSLPSNLADPVLIDPVAGTFTPLNNQAPANSFTLPAQDYPLILTSFSALNAAAAPSAGLGSIKVYPNPFRPALGHTTMTFTQLPANARIRIATVSGSLVRELTADGTGTAVWDVANRSGAQVGSGVYFVAIDAGGDRRAIKIAIQR